MSQESLFLDKQDAIVLTNYANELAKHLNDNPNALTPKNDDFKTGWKADCDGMLHGTIVPTDGEWQKQSKKFGRQRFLRLGVPIQNIIYIFTPNNILEAIFVYDKDEKQIQIWPIIAK
jgi:hypothetical protein